MPLRRSRQPWPPKNAPQGFATGDLDKDAFAPRLFVEKGLEIMVAQSERGFRGARVKGDWMSEPPLPPFFFTLCLGPDPGTHYQNYCYYYYPVGQAGG